MLNGLLKAVPVGTKIGDQEYEKVMAYAIAWSVGGLYESAERFQFH